MREWRDVCGYEGSYRVSSDGLVYSVPRIVQRSSVPQRIPGKMLKPCQGKGRNIYPAVYLQVPGEKKRRVCVHRLVAEVFIPRIDGANHVNHKNSDKTDNRVENLEWVTLQENAQHAAVNGNVGKRILTCGDVVAIKKALQSPYRGIVRALGAKYGVTPEAISAIRHGKNWKHVS